MTWSLNEIEALSRKAARGAGYSWGLAEDTGKAVRWLESHALPGAAALAAHLHAGDGQALSDQTPRPEIDAWTAPKGSICPILAGTMLADGTAAPHGAPLTLTNVRAPLLLLPFLSWMAQSQGRPVGLDLSDAAITLTCDGELTKSAPIPALNAASLSLRFDAMAEDQTLPAGLRSACGTDTVAALNAFAARTYAPSTEESRLAGAGAGLSDND